MVEQTSPPISIHDVFRLQHSIVEQWQQLPPDAQVQLVPVLLGQWLNRERGPWTQAVLEAIRGKPYFPTVPETNTNAWFERYFEQRLAEVEAVLTPWARRKFYREDDLTRDDALQEVRIVLWRRFSENPLEWATSPRSRWLAYAKVSYRWKVVGFHRQGKRKLGQVASDVDAIAQDRDITDEEALAMMRMGRTGNGTLMNGYAYPRDIQLAELRIDLQQAVKRGLERLCDSQRRDMPLLLEDMLAGYTLEEICQRHGWTRNRGVTLMRKLRTVFFHELTGEQKTGYLGSHHPLTHTEKQRIRELRATGLSYRKIAARVGRSASAVEALCKHYPPELVEQVRKLRAQGLSYAQIARRTGRSKSYIAWLVSAELKEDETDSPANALAAR